MSRLWPYVPQAPRYRRLGPFFSLGPALAAGSPGSITFPGSLLGIRVYLAFDADPSGDPEADWSWTEITGYVYWRDKISIRRGRMDEQSQAVASTCTLTLKNYALPPYNLDGIFTPRNPNGPFFGRFGHNTPLRIDVDPGTGASTRYVGFVTRWPPRRDTSGREKYISITANGVLQRLSQGNSPLGPALFRIIVNSSPTAYWPANDGLGSTAIADATGLNAPMTVSGSVTFATDAPVSSDPMPSLATGASLRGVVSNPAAGTAWTFGVMFKAPTAVAVATTIAEWTTSGTLSRWTLVLTPGAPDTLTVNGYTSAGTLTVTITTDFTDIDSIELYDEWVIALPACKNAGTGVTARLDVIEVDNGATSSTGGAAVSQTAGVATAVTTVATADTTGIIVGHYAFWDRYVFDEDLWFDIKSGAFAWNGEATGDRFERLCGESNIAHDPVTLGADLMGQQTSNTLLALLREIEAAGEGQLTERRNSKLGLDVRELRENQTVDLTLDHAGHQLQPPFEPTDDDQSVRNDITVTRLNGSSARQIDQDGPLGVDRVGRYDEGVSLNLYTDGQAALHAAYRVVHGTIDEMRHPRVKLSLSHDPDLIPDWLACDISSRVLIINPPADLPPDDIDQVIEGYSETLDQFTWDVELNLTPFSAYRIFRTSEDSGDIDTFLGYLIPDTCVLAEDLDTTETGVDITTDPLWSTNADDWTPAVPIVVGGERMLVSAVSGASNPQTLTVTRSVNTVVKTHTSGAEVEMATPGVTRL